MYAGACERAGDITRVDATWNAARRGIHTGDPHRGPTQGTHTGNPLRGPAQGTHTGDPHRGPTQGTHTEGRAPQRTHHRRGGPHRGPTQNTHRQHEFSPYPLPPAPPPHWTPPLLPVPHCAGLDCALTPLPPHPKIEVNLLGVITISRGCFEALRQQ